jgi:hypothetical protein
VVLKKMKKMVEKLVERKRGCKASLPVENNILNLPAPFIGIVVEANEILFIFAAEWASERFRRPREA